MANSDTQLPDINQLLKQMSLPGVDISAMVESRRKDIEALAAANQRAYEGLQALAQRQAQILQETMQKWQSGVQGGSMGGMGNMGQSLQEGATKQAEAARLAFEQALANMRELAEMAAQSQAKAYEVIHKRIQESLEETRQQFQPKSGT